MENTANLGLLAVQYTKSSQSTRKESMQYAYMEKTPRYKIEVILVNNAWSDIKFF
jgi:hypothetical protein